MLLLAKSYHKGTVLLVDLNSLATNKSSTISEALIVLSLVFNYEWMSSPQLNDHQVDECLFFFRLPCASIRLLNLHCLLLDQAVCTLRSPLPPAVMRW